MNALSAGLNKLLGPAKAAGFTSLNAVKKKSRTSQLISTSDLSIRLCRAGTGSSSSNDEEDLSFHSDEFTVQLRYRSIADYRSVMVDAMVGDHVFDS